MENRIQSFKDLIVWQEGHKLVVMVYKATKSFPNSEIYGLASQMQRAAVSITSNIAEGFCRESFKEKNQFFSTSRGSLTELENQLLVAKDIGYINSNDFDLINNQLISVHRLLNAFILKTKSFIPHSKFHIPNSTQKGFTLIEAIVATSVFAFVVSSMLGVYVSTIQLDRKSRSQRAVAQNARFIMEFLAKEVRNGTINYASFAGGTVAGTGDLYLENQASAIEHFSLSGTNLVMNKNGANTNMNSSGVKVTNLKYYIQPVGDPYTAAKTYNEQPRVTIAMELTSNYGTQATDLVKMDLQDTFAIRNYPSRLAAGLGSSPNLTVTLFATPPSINMGESSTLTWFSSGATSCTASSSPAGNWSGSQPLSGTKVVSPFSTVTYTLVCTGTGGSVQQSTTVTVIGGDTTPPVVTAFDVNPKTTSGSVTATFTATDLGGSHLNNAELWRSVYNSSNCTTTVVTGCSWSTVNTATDPTSNDNGPWSGSITDIPPGGFSYIYGTHVNDYAGNFGLEPARIKVDVTVTSSGTGADGPITVSGTFNCQTSHLIVGRTTPDCVTVSVTQNANAGDPSIKVSDQTPFAAGDEVLIIQMNGTGAGNYEFHTITTVQNNNFILFDSNLTNAYKTATAQVIRVPNYTTVTVQSGGTFTVSAWNGTVGGVLPFRASVSLAVNSGGTIDVSGKGYRGGPSASGVGVNGQQGEGYCGLGSVSTAQNCGGGGGGTQSFSGGWYGAIGGGGGYATTGDNGTRDARDGGGSSTAGVGGTTYGIASLLSQIFAGSGGGASGNYSNGLSGSTAPGGAGGGIIYTAATAITVNGTMKASGANGTWVGNSLGGAGGAGGSIYLKGDTVSLGTNLVQAAKGASFTGTLFGSVGRISVFYHTSITGTTSPAATVTLFPPDTIPPVVTAFDVNPKSTSGSVTATFTATDSGGSHLKNAELWRAVYDSSTCTTTVVTGCSWSTVNTATASAGLDSWSGSMTDNPPAGSYIYGTHVYDNAGNFGLEQPARIKVDSTGPTFVTWNNISSVSSSLTTSVSSTNNLTAATSCGWGCGATSQQSIASGDGYVQFSTNENNTYKMGGLTHGNTTDSYTDITYAMYPELGGALEVYENGAYRGIFGTYVAGDVFKVAVVSGVVKYYKNGTLIYTSTVAPAYPLIFDSSFYTANATETNVVISTDGVISNPVQWAHLTNNVNIVGNSLTANYACNWTCGGYSNEKIGGGDGYVEFSTSENNTYKMLGLTPQASETTYSYTDIGYAAYPAADGNIYVYENNANKGSFGAYAAGDVFRVAVVSGAVKYSKNGTVFYTSLIAPTYPLLVDYALYSSGATINNVKINNPPLTSSFATGGTITTSGAYTIHTFTSSGTFTVNGSGTVQVLVVAGGGSGSSGGGGAGGMLENNSYNVTPGSISVTVGSGGTVNNSNAGNSVFGTLIATAGGRGQDSSGAGFNGGSGGGANAGQNNHGTGIAGQGSNGGDAAGANGGGGGGGGGAVGTNGSGSSGGNGGGGRVSSISGSSVTYAGGGGGAGLSAGGNGGAGGGGNGGVNSSTAGATNRGGGGGGGWYVAGASGGSGIVIVRYIIPLTLTETPSSVPAGNSVTVSWTGVPNPLATDWIGLYTQPKGSDFSYLAYIYAGSCSTTAGSAPAASGSCSFVIPSSTIAGTYLFAFFENVPPANGLTSSNTLTVTAPPTLTWTGTTSGSQNMSATPTLPFKTPGTYTITVNTAMTMTFKGSAGGAASGGTVHNAGSGGGGGGAVTTGTSVPLVTGKTYTLIVGGHGVGTAGDSTGGSGGVTTFRNTTDNQTLVSLNGGTGGQAIICGGSGGTLATGSNGVTGGAGGLGGYVGTIGCTNNTWNGTAGGNATNGAGGGGGGAYNPTGSTGGVGGTGSVAGHAASGRTGGQGGGSSFTGVSGEFGGGGGGTSGVASGSTTGNNGQDGAGVFVFVSAP